MKDEEIERGKGGMRNVSEIRGEKLLRTADNERQQRERGLVGSPNKG